MSIRLLEKWRQKLDKNFIVGAVLMDLTKSFDCIPHDLIISKLAANGIEKETVRLRLRIVFILRVGNKDK